MCDHIVIIMSTNWCVFKKFWKFLRIFTYFALSGFQIYTLFVTFYLPNYVSVFVQVAGQILYTNVWLFSHVTSMSKHHFMVLKGAPCQFYDGKGV